MNNIWTSLKKELGFVTASIQYFELSFRVLQKEHKDILDNKGIEDLAKEYGLSVSQIPTDIESWLAGSYIIQVHSCVEKFLIDFHNLIGSPTYNIEYDYKKDINYLDWTMMHSLGDN